MRLDGKVAIVATKPAPSGIEGPEVTPLGPRNGWQHPWLRINRLRSPECSREDAMRFGRWIWCVAVLLTVGCTSWAQTPHAQTPHAAEPSTCDPNTDHPIQHAVILAVDGLRRDTLFEYLTRRPGVPNGLHDLLGVRQGRRDVELTKAIAVRQGVTVFPSYTYPAWASVFTGMFPGAHGITGNMLFFRDSAQARYYSERHLDAVLANTWPGYLASDMSEDVKTLYELVGERNGDSLVIHHMMGRGVPSDRHRLPSTTSLRAYLADESRNYDRNALFETVDALCRLNGGCTPTGTTRQAFRLPTVTTIYFAGLDHELHIGGRDAGTNHLTEVDSIVSQFINGATVSRLGLGSEAPADSRPWKGLKTLAGEQYCRTVFVLVADHGHSEINWRAAVGTRALERAVNGIARGNGRRYQLVIPTLTNPNVAKHDVVATLNGGLLGIYVQAGAETWARDPDYDNDLLPLLRGLLAVLHETGRDPETVLLRQAGEYVEFRYSMASGRLDRAQRLPLRRSRFQEFASLFPDAVRRIEGLLPVSRTMMRRYNAPDIIVLADRSRKQTFANDQDVEFQPGAKLPSARQLKSDHGHLTLEDSLVPIIFASESFRRPSDPEREREPSLSSVCNASVVDITPTLVELLFGAGSWSDQAVRHPRHAGRSLVDTLKKAQRGLEDQNVCPPAVFTRYEVPTDRIDAESDLNLESYVEFHVRNAKAALFVNPESFHRWHRIRRTLTWAIDEDSFGTNLHSMDRLRGAPNSGQSSEHRPEKLWMISTIRPTDSAVFSDQKPVAIAPKQLSGAIFVDVPVKQSFDVVATRTVRRHCEPGATWDWVITSNRWEFPEEFVIQLVYRKEPVDTRLYYFDVPRLDVPVRAVELLGHRKYMTPAELAAVRTELAQFKPGVGLDRSVTGGYRFVIPTRYFSVNPGNDPGRLFGIRHTCATRQTGEQ